MSDLMSHFQDTLKDIYYAEKQIYKALPKMIRAASDSKLRAGFEKHRDETEGQIQRLEQAFELLDMPAKGKKCPAIDGILEEGSSLISEHDKGAGLDAALAAAAQAVEHYEIARYGTLCSWADALNIRDVGKLLGQNLNQEEKCDETLSELAIASLNPAAIMGEDDSESVVKPKSGGARYKPESGKLSGAAAKSAAVRQR